MKKVIFGVLGALLIVGIFSQVFGTETEPMSAEGMTAAERSQHDSEIIFEALASDDVEAVEVNHSYDSIKVTLTGQSADQYIGDVADEIESAVIQVLVNERANLTLEKDRYYIYVYSADGRLLN